MDIRLLSFSDKLETGKISALAFSPSGKYLVSAQQNGWVTCWNLKRGKVENEFFIPSKEINQIQFTQEFTCFLSGYACLYEYKIFHPEIRNQFWRIPGGSLTQISPNGKVVASAQSYESWLSLDVEEPFLILQEYENRKVRILRIGDVGRRLFKINLYEMAFSPDSQLISFLIELNEEGMDWEYRLYCIHLDEKEDLTSYHETPYRISPICFSPNNQYFAYGHVEDSSITILKIAHEIKFYRDFFGHEEAIESLTFNHDDKLLASGSKDGILRIWDVQSDCLLISRQHDQPISQLLFHPKDNILVLGDNVGKIYIGELE